MKFFFDENIGIPLVRGLKEFGVNSCHLTDHFSAGTEDHIWLESIGKKGWFLITQDHMIRKRPREKAAIEKFNIGAFILIGRELGKWQRIRQVVNAWPEIEARVKKIKPPFIFNVSTAGRKLNRLR